MRRVFLLVFLFYLDCTCSHEHNIFIRLLIVHRCSRDDDRLVTVVERRQRDRENEDIA